MLYKFLRWKSANKHQLFSNNDWWWVNRLGKIIIAVTYILNNAFFIYHAYHIQSKYEGRQELNNNNSSVGELNTRFNDVVCDVLNLVQAISVFK